MPGVFISYRREDTAGYSGRIYDHFRDRFGEKNVFIDVDTIQPGEDFVQVIEEKVGACDALVAVIGKQWVSVLDEAGKRRLDDPHDFVRLEIAAALARNVRVIPVLVGGAHMPRLEELPEALAGLLRRNAIELSDTGFQQLLPRLIQAVEAAGAAAHPEGVPESAAPRPVPVVATPARVQPPSAKRLFYYAGATVAVALAGWLLWPSHAVNQPPVAPVVSVENPPRKRIPRDECLQGYVWREAGPNDHVCVTPQTRRQAAIDNRAAASRVNPTDRIYGKDTCAQGYVWREAIPGDRVCVLPEIRRQAAADNQAVAGRRVTP
jgi:hypothetical protein